MIQGKRKTAKSFTKKWTKSIPLPIMGKSKFEDMDSRLDLKIHKKEIIKAQSLALKFLKLSPHLSLQKQTDSQMT